MTIYYIPSVQEMINDAHIIRAKFTPAHLVDAHIDEDSGQQVQARFVDAYLEFWTTENVLEEDVSYNGSVHGVVAISKRMTYRSLEAEYLWDALKRSAYALSDIPSKDEKVVSHE
jgi:hypothetical protein